MNPVGCLRKAGTTYFIDGRYMKKSQQHSIIAACMFPALLVLSTTVFAEDTARYVKQQNTGNTDTRFWSIPPISKRWNAPPKRGEWTIPPISRQWGIPKRPPHWTIPRTANDLLTDTK